MPKHKVLFVCIHNSARSQMAEELLRKLALGRFEVESAGIEPGKLNLIVIEALKEIDIDISHKIPQKVTDLFSQGRQYDYVITVCDETNAERCPTFPGKAQRIHWGFPDPSRFEGDFQEKLIQTRQVRDMIKERIQQWLTQV